MTNIESISFQYNRLETVESNAFEGLNNLQDLSFHRNKLTSFDHVIFTNEIKRMNLNLSFNNLVSFIITSDNYYLDTLDLSSNKMKIFFLLENINLNNLILNNNILTKLSVSAKANYKLLRLENNNIIEFTNKILKGFMRLNTLSLKNILSAKLSVIFLKIMKFLFTNVLLIKYGDKAERLCRNFSDTLKSNISYDFLLNSHMSSNLSRSKENFNHKRLLTRAFAFY